MHHQIGRAIESIEDAIRRRMPKPQLWSNVQMNIALIRPLIETTSEITKAEDALRNAALEYTGGFNVNASIFLDDEEEAHVLDVLKDAVEGYRGVLQHARLSAIGRDTLIR